jgi:hypothetical protein
MSDEAKLNTDRELWREREGDYYADSIHVTEGGGIGINCGGHVIVKPLQAWFALAVPPVPTADWQDVQTCPLMRSVLLFAVTAQDGNGRPSNWRMATGCRRNPGTAREAETDWEWDGHTLKIYDHQPTHWMPLPSPPQELT